MSKKYNRINSVDDIDTSRITVANINDRYIDAKGNRFATRFNIRTKKIQIVRIALGEEEARKSRGIIIQGLVQKKISEGKKKHFDEQEEIEEAFKELDAQNPDTPDTGEQDTGIQAPDLSEIENPVIHEDNSEIQPSVRKKIPAWLVETGIQPAANVNHEDLMALLPENYALLSERIFGVINNVKNSGIMTKIAEIDDAIDFTNIYDHSISPKMEETKKFIIEFQKYSERPEHYFTMLEKPFREYLMQISESEVMDFLKAYFIGQNALDVLESTHLFVKSVEEKTSSATETIADPAKKQFLEYAYSTCEFLTNYIKEEGSKILGWMTKQKVFSGF